MRPLYRLLPAAVVALNACPTKANHTYTDANIVAVADTIDSLAANTRNSDAWIMPPTLDSGRTSEDGGVTLDERRFVVAARCSSAMPGTVRGMLAGRFDDAGQVPVDTALGGVMVQLIVTPTDSRLKYFDRLNTAGQGQYFFWGVPTQGHYELEALHTVIRDFRYTISEGFIEDLGKRCILPSRDGRVPLSRHQQQVQRDKGL